MVLETVVCVCGVVDNYGNQSSEISVCDGFRICGMCAAECWLLEPMNLNFVIG